MQLTKTENTYVKRWSALSLQKKIKEKKWNKLDDGEKSLVIYINIININNDSLWYYPSWLLFIHLSLCHIRRGMLYCSRVSVVPFPLSFFSHFFGFFFSSKHILHTSFQHTTSSVVRTHREWLFFFPPPLLHLFNAFLHRFYFFDIELCDVIVCPFIFFKHQLMTLRSFPFGFVRSLFPISSVFFCTCDESASVCFRGI